jgi:hypothetical protein
MNLLTVRVVTMTLPPPQAGGTMHAIGKLFLGHMGGLYLLQYFSHMA